MTNKYYLLIALTIIQHAVCCQVIKPDLQDSTRWNVVNRTMEPINENGKKGVRLNEVPGNGLMILKGSNFSNGTVEIDIKGSNKFQAEFCRFCFSWSGSERI